MPAIDPAAPQGAAGGLTGLLEASEWTAGRGRRSDGAEALIITVIGGPTLVLLAPGPVLTELGEKLIAPSVIRPPQWP